MVQSNNDNIILFPKLKETLESESLQALKDKKYKEALVKLNELIAYQVNSHEVFIGKLICLNELGKYKKAEDMCEELLQKYDEHYYHYLHIYLTILFQTNQYNLLMELINDELINENLPEATKSQFSQLYELSSKMKEDVVKEEASLFEEELSTAFEQQNYQRQWQKIEKMCQLNVSPTSSIINLLSDNEVHPVVKTSIVNWLQVNDVNQPIKLIKFNQIKTLQLNKIESIEDQPLYHQTLLMVKDLEQENPSQYDFLERLLYQYIYVRYPLLPVIDDVIIIADALKYIGKDYLDLEKNASVEENYKLVNYIEEIKLCQSLYLSIIEE